ncbi:MAG: hypothetical protein KAT65_29450 [Methanophagales archaeon]|nr:hypothetical protein [Methanophagales archaeon]
MMSIAIITTVVILTTLIVVFLVEFSVIVPVLKNKKITFVDAYALTNSGLLILVFVAIHKYLFTSEIFTYSWLLLMANILCFAFYQLLRVFQAKVEYDFERENK